MKPKTKPEPKIQIKLSVPQSSATAFDATRKEADQLGFDWNATMIEQMEKTNAEFSQFLAQHRAKLQANTGLTPSHSVSSANGADRERA
jgi:hypothetical protein